MNEIEIAKKIIEAELRLHGEHLSETEMAAQIIHELQADGFAFLKFEG